MSEMQNKFIEFMKKDGLSENTYMSYANDVKLFEKYYNDSYGEELDQIIHADISTYINHLFKHNISPKTINRKVAALKMYNKFLIGEGRQENIVIVDKDYIKVQKTMINKELPTSQEINRLKHFASRDEKNAIRDYCFISIFIYCGLRESEIITIRLVDIKLDERFINNKEPLNRNFCNRLLNKYKDLCKIDKLHPHLLRAYFCTNALHNAGYTIDQVANQAGHSSLNTTKGYLVTSQEDLISLANKL